jgi:hypothetical protein
MEFFRQISQQPLFQLIGAIIVLLLTEQRPVYGLCAFVAWAVWMWVGNRQNRRLK